jgi:uncharacterized protein YjdB
MNAGLGSSREFAAACVRRLEFALVIGVACVACEGGSDDRNAGDDGTPTGPPALLPRVLGVSIVSAPGVLHVGEQALVVASVTAVDGAATVVIWSSSNIAVARVSNGGLVTAVAIGSTEVTATSAFDNSKSASATITVGVRPSVNGVTIIPASAVVEIGGSQVLTAIVSAAGGASTAVTWASSDQAIATISPNGVVTGVAEGTATITARSAFDATRSSTIPVTVVSPPP